MNKIKVIHIHDGHSKFIGTFLRHFNNDAFENELIIFGGKKNLTDDLMSSTRLYIDLPMRTSEMKKALKEVVDICNTAQIVVLYDLTFTKSMISTKLNPNVKIIWAFWGYELYRKMGNRMFSDATIAILDTDKKAILPTKIKKLQTSLKELINFGTTREMSFNKALQRIDHFWGLSEFEYNYLKKYWKTLPAFLQRRFPFVYDEVKLSDKSNYIILGNNRNPFNNHIDMLNAIAPLNNTHQVQYKLLFSYGMCALDSVYAQTILKQAKQIDNLEIIDKLIPRDDFNKLYHNASALVINGYRQMAMGNIFQALRSKVKIYLNPKNALYDWLIHEGFKIYCISELAHDIENNKITLTEEESTYNLECLVKFCEKYNADAFHQKVIKIGSN